MTRLRHGFAIRLLLLAGLSCAFTRTTAAATVPGDFPTIQAAINAVVAGALPNGTTIDVQPGVYGEALVISSTNRSFTLRGTAGASATVVDAAGRNAAALTVYYATGQVVIRGLTFRNGAPPVAAGGGFVIQQSAPSFVDCVFEGNAAQFGGGGTLITASPTFNNTIIRNNLALRSGGGVYMVDGSRPVFTGGEISGNRSGTGAPGVGNVGVGGGIDSRNSSPTLRGTRIVLNRSTFAAGGIYHGGQFGSPYGVSALVVEDAEVSDNIASPYSAGDGPSEGGGIHIEDNAVATVTRARILRNRANSGGGLNAYRARYDVTNSMIDGNQAVARTDGGPAGGFGGGIHAISTNVGAVHPPSVVNLTNTVLRNSVGITGGGIVVTGDVGLPATLTLTNSLVDSNQAQNQGGGILLSRANLTAGNSMITRNVVTGGSTPFGGGMLISTESSAALSNTTVAQNTAGVYGGGIFMDGTAALDVNGSRLYDNRANLSSGFGGGGVFVGPNGNNTGQIVNSIVADNTGYQIVEHACPTTRLTYNSNTITPRAGSSDVYLSGCAPGHNITTIGAFNNLNNTSGNNSNLPRFVHFLAAPAAGRSFTLAWSAGRASTVTIGGVGTFNNTPTGTADVAPTTSTTYTLNASASGPNGGAYSPVTAGVTFVPMPAVRRATTVGDFDGDGRTEIGIFRPTNSNWYIRYAATGLGLIYPWGGVGDIPVVGDYDGDGLADIAVFRPSNGTWYIRFTVNGALASYVWGGGGDRPVQGDYTGDGKTDIAIFRPSNSTWYIRDSATGLMLNYVWGGPGDEPVQGDFDGDGTTDIAIFRPSTSTWYVRYTATGAGITLVWGGSGDIPVQADYDGDGKSDIAVFRVSTGQWFVRYTATGQGITLIWGGGSDVPVPGDYDGDGLGDIAIFRPSTGEWFIRFTANGSAQTLVWGGTGDVPVLKRQ
jgi:predicted outer membrane repeat protein